MTPPPATTSAARTKPGRRGARGAAARATARRGSRSGVRARSARSPARSARARSRSSGGARAAVSARPPLRLRPLPVLGTIGSHAFRAGRSLPDSPLLDRLLRGRLWIGLLALLLGGLVALNVSLLKLNAEAGKNAERAKALRIRNGDLRARVSRLGSGEPLQAAGRKLGLAMPSPGRVHYLTVRPGDARRAARSLRSLKSVPVAVVPAPVPPVAETPAAGAAPAETPPPAPSPAAPTPAPAGAAPQAPATPGAGVQNGGQAAPTTGG